MIVQIEQQLNELEQRRGNLARRIASAEQQIQSIAGVGQVQVRVQMRKDREQYEAVMDAIADMKARMAPLLEEAERSRKAAAGKLSDAQQRYEGLIEALKVSTRELASLLAETDQAARDLAVTREQAGSRRYGSGQDTPRPVRITVQKNANPNNLDDFKIEYTV